MAHTIGSMSILAFFLASWSLFFLLQLLVSSSWLEVSIKTEWVFLSFCGQIQPMFLAVLRAASKCLLNKSSHSLFQVWFSWDLLLKFIVWSLNLECKAFKVFLVSASFKRASSICVNPCSWYIFYVFMSLI